MLQIAIITNLLCGVVVLITGALYLKNTLKNLKLINHDSVAPQNISNEFELGDFIKVLFIAILWSFLLSTIKHLINIDFTLNILLTSFTTALTIESVSYIFNKNEFSLFYKILSAIILALLLSGTW
ncbi:hypothetical protein [Bacillus sp. AFS041924]|uniref:hypothetical protein n=1 Tax=Bacillus sp. AFS041924 TaxID=2033503 RepID=UPI000BFC69B6|nr:hypothetical protein [Bacillus sp. AFS041924]PGS51012.1 hypothetical protein COC46_12035 [Bacillus sp. AFS041924]